MLLLLFLVSNVCFSFYMLDFLQKAKYFYGFFIHFMFVIILTLYIFFNDKNSPRKSIFEPQHT